MATPPPPAPASPPPKRAALTILLVDDDDDMATALARLLERAGHVVHRSRSGSEAIGVAGATASLDAAVVDLVLPGAGGLEVVREIRAAHPRCRIVGVTGFGARSLPEAFRRAGADVFLTKPVERDALLRAVSGTGE